MTGWQALPVIYEIDTAVWLGDLSRAAGQLVTLADVTGSDWDAITPDGANAVWLMGVWERSPAGLALADANQGLQASFREALPDLRREDVIGSPYCVRRYVAAEMFGGRDGLAAARAALAARGVRLILDYVPNHVAPDHPWVMSDPELFVRGSEDDLRADPAGWVAAGGQVLAHGRDPYFPPWPDVVQLNAFSPALRAATAETLADIASQCDGIRCDMAMLMINDIFAKTWGHAGGARAGRGLLACRARRTARAAPGGRARRRGVLGHGVGTPAAGIRLLLRQAALRPDHRGGRVRRPRPPPGRSGYQARLLRFLENHDEPRVASRMDPAAERAAAVSIATLPGATLWYEGQFEGRRVRPPVFLARRPDEPADTELADWYRRLLATVAGHGVRTGTWRLLEAAGWPDNQSCRNLLAWSWSGAATDGTWWSSTFPASPRRAGSPSAGRTCPGVTGGWRTCCPATVFVRDGGELAGPRACSSPWSRGSATSSHRGEHWTCGAAATSGVRRPSRWPGCRRGRARRARTRRTR